MTARAEVARSPSATCVVRVSAILVSIVLTAAPAPASACSLVCGVALAPLGTSTLPARLPVNGVFVAVPDGGGAVTAATVERTRAGVTETLTLVVDGPVLAIPDPQVDDRLTVTASLSCGRAPVPETTFLHVMPAAPIPTSLGLLEVEPSHLAPVAVWDNRGACTSDLGSTVAPYALELDPSLAPWADALVLRAMLDDASWNETPDARVAPHFVFARCADVLPSQSAHDAARGEHRLRIEGTLRGVDGTLRSNEVTFELTCTGTGGGSGGCATAPPGRSRAGSVAAIVALALALARRRRA